MRGRLLEAARSLGPGIVSGASDTDPTTVATMAVVGATTGYALSWLTVLTYPMLANVQLVSARVGVVTRRGLQQLVRGRFGARWGMLLLASVLAVNLVTLAADLEAGSSAIGLMFGAGEGWFSVPLGLALLALLVFGSYARIERVLKYVLLVFFAYVAAAFLAHPDWAAVVRATVTPTVSLQPQYVAAMLAVLGTTLTSYAYVWEAVEESERRLPVRRLGLAQADAAFGMLAAVAVFWFILIATAATAGAGHRHIETAAQAATALQPAAGPAAKYVFALGLLASSCIAVPVLAATSAYLAGAEFEFPFGLSRRVPEAAEFYAILTLAIAVAVAITFLGVPAIKLLFAASIAGALGTPVSLAFLLLVAQDRELMHGRPIGLASRIVGWGTLALVAAVGVWFLAGQAAALAR